MNICILNSGFGSRLKRYTESKPKGLVSICGMETLLSRQVKMLSSLGNHKYHITTGYLDGMIQSYMIDVFPDISVAYTPNARYATTNYITSLELLRGRCDDELVLLHGDLVFEESVARDILASSRSVVVIDSTLPLPEKDFKARMKDGKVVEIGVDVFGSDCYACQPFYHLTKGDWNIWQEEIHSFCTQGKESVYAENALNNVTGRMELYAFDIKGRFCMEVDNEEDLLTVRRTLESCDGK